MKSALALFLPLLLVVGCGGRHVSAERFVQLYDQDQSAIAYTRYTGRSFGRDSIDEYGLETGSVVHPTATYWTYTKDLPSGFPDHPQKERQPLPPWDARAGFGSEPSVEDARHALVAFVEQRHDAALDVNLPALKNAIAVIQPDGVVMLEGWRCDLSHKTFVYTVANPPVFLQVTGTFLRGDDGHWQAQVTRDERN